MKRNRNPGIQKVCSCGRPKWPKCPHAWYFRFKPRGKPRWQFSLDAELGRHIETLTDAEREAARIRAAILAGTFQRANHTPEPPATPRLSQPLNLIAPDFIKRLETGGKDSWLDDKGRLARLRDYQTPNGGRLGEWEIVDVNEEALEAFFASLTDLAVNTRNHYVTTIKAFFRWAAKKGYLSRSPLSDDCTLKRKKGAQRRRRVSPEEEAALLTVAGALDRRVGVRLVGLIIAAIETGCRLGELLALQWGDVDLVKRTLFVRAQEAGARKTGHARLLPVSERLLNTLDGARSNPAGEDYPASAYVFGALGERVYSVVKTWETVVLKAHGYEPVWRRNGLSPESRAQLAVIDLHFHDLRHEAGNRWLEKGWPLHHIQEMYGHASLAQTSTYLHATGTGLQESMQRFDPDFRGKTVVNEDQIEPRADYHEDQAVAGKSLEQ